MAAADHSDAVSYVSLPDPVPAKKETTKAVSPEASQTASLVKKDAAKPTAPSKKEVRRLRLQRK